MAISREKKETMVAEYVEKLRRSQAMHRHRVSWPDDKQIEALRRELRGCDSELAVSKNTLLGPGADRGGPAGPRGAAVWPDGGGVLLQ